MRQLDRTPGFVAGIFRDRATADQSITSLRGHGFAARDIKLNDVPRPAGLSHLRGMTGRHMLVGAAAGGAGAVVLEATVFAIPPAVPTLLGGSLIAATLGGAVGLLAAAVAPLLRTDGLDLFAEIRRGRPIVVVAADDRLAKERIRGLLRQQGAAQTVDLDSGDEDRVEFARSFSEIAGPLRAHCAERYGSGAHIWLALMPAYLFGWDRANRPDFHDRRWDEAVPELRDDWSRRHPDHAWPDVADAVAEGWDAAERR